MPNRKPDTDIEFVIRTDNDGWYEAELKVAGKVVSTLYTGTFDNAIQMFHDAFPSRVDE